ncbi:hypothetical protein HCA61_05505 [Rhodococcus sp. HNM0563]|nr:hypothetical protein [Rhodococcus sp. HNM0563]
MIRIDHRHRIGRTRDCNRVPSHSGQMACHPIELHGLYQFVICRHEEVVCSHDDEIHAEIGPLAPHRLAQAVVALAPSLIAVVIATTIAMIARGAESPIRD